MDSNTKECITCLTTQDLSFYGQYKNRKGFNIYRNECKACRVKREYQRNKTSDKRSEYCKTWRQNNQEKIKVYENERHKQKRLTCEIHKLKLNMQCYIRSLVYGKRKNVQYVSCSREQLEKWFSHIMPFGLKWTQPNEWQIDHVIPLSFFDLNNENEISIAYHWTNMRPVFEKENREKQDKVKADLVIMHSKTVLNFLKAYNSYQVDVVIHLWQTVEVWYGKNAQDEENFSGFLKWIIRSQGSNS